MNANHKARILLTGVGGQGTLTATKILAQAVMDKGLAVTAGEIHGMAQRGGVVESAVMVGGYLSPRIGRGEADVLLGFEPLETYRAISSLKPGGLVISNSEFIPPIGVSLGREGNPDLDTIVATVSGCAGETHFVPCLSLAREAGSPASANMVILGALCSLGAGPVSVDDLKETMAQRLKPQFRASNEKAVDLGAAAVTNKG